MESSDLLVIEQIRAGNVAAFDALFTDWYGKLTTYAFSVLQNEALAEEVVQTVFCRIWEKRRQWHVTTSLKAYLYGSVYHRCIDGLRRDKHVQKYQRHVLQSSDAQAAPASGKAELKELEAKLQYALSQLPGQCRAIFQLSRFGGFKYREIAEQLDLSVKTVEAQISKALKHFAGPADRLFVTHNSFVMDDLLIKYIMAEATPEESTQVQQWLAADAANQARFEKLQAVWLLAAQPCTQLTTDTHQALQRLKQTLAARQAAPVKRLWTRIGTAAAAVVGFAGVVLGAYVVMKPKTPAKKTTPIFQPDTLRKKRLSVDTLPAVPADTIPVIQPRKKKQPIPAKPAQPARPKKKAPDPISPIDTLYPIQSIHTVPTMKKKQPLPARIVDTTLIKRKQARPAQPATPIQKRSMVNGQWPTKGKSYRFNFQQTRNDAYCVA